MFDGHGGPEVARFCERHFAEELERNMQFGKKNYEAALTETFLRMDEMMLTEAGRKEILAIKKETEEGRAESDSFAGCTANVVLIT